LFRRNPINSRSQIRVLEEAQETQDHKLGLEETRKISAISVEIPVSVVGLIDWESDCVEQLLQDVFG
jgi:hypothetical protein